MEDCSFSCSSEWLSVADDDLVFQTTDGRVDEDVTYIDDHVVGTLLPSRESLFPDMPPPRECHSALEDRPEECSLRVSRRRGGRRGLPHPRLHRFGSGHGGGPVGAGGTPGTVVPRLPFLRRALRRADVWKCRVNNGWGGEEVPATDTIAGRSSRAAGV